jgi:carbon storage regulator
MLVLSRRQNESIVIGDGITITVIEVRGDKVRLGIVCPRDASVHRQEVWVALHGNWKARPAVAFDPAWLAWKDGTVARLARAIHDERAWERLPILADALEEAGCAEAIILGHCRAGTSHLAGCWVVDELLRLRGSSGQAEVACREYLPPAASPGSGKSPS